jgi:hypothetical protein
VQRNGLGSLKMQDDRFGEMSYVSFSLSELAAPHFVVKITENGKEMAQNCGVF